MSGAPVTGRSVARGVAGAAALIAALTLLARLAGFGRTLVFTNTVGADSTGDTYLAANTVPNIVFEIVAGGALASLVIPMLAGGIASGNTDQVRRTASALLGWTLLILTPLAIVVAFAAEPIADALLRGGGDRTEVALGARFLLVFAPQIVLYGIGIVLAGVLQAHRRFAGPALAPLLSSLVVAAAYLLFAIIGGSGTVEDLSTPAELVLGVGTTLGVVALSLSLLIPVRRLRLGLRPALRFPVGAAPRVRRLAAAGVLTLAGQQAVAAVAIVLASQGPKGTQVVYFAGLTLFLVPWAALAVPVATSVYPGLAERAETGDEAGYRRALAPAAVVTVAASAVAAGVLVAVSGPMARVFLAREPDETVAALRDTIIAFAPGLVGYSLVALLSRALYARGLWKAPTVCIAGGWLLAVVADLLLARTLPVEDRALALGAGHSIGVTVAGLSLLVVVARVAGPTALHGVVRGGGAALVGSAAGAALGLFGAQALGADPVPRTGVLAAVVVGLVAAAIVLVIAGAVMMGTARGTLTGALQALHRADDQPAATTGGAR
ncbi:MAG: murein biosynthesis integral membrane protein MurJ [Blastococcus sp.]